MAEAGQEVPLNIILVLVGLSCVIVVTVLVIAMVVCLGKKHHTKQQMRQVFIVSTVAYLIHCL